MVKLTRRLLLSCPVVILAADLNEVRGILDNCLERFVGLAITIGDQIAVERLALLAWHIVVPVANLPWITVFANEWLAALTVADHSMQESLASEFKLQRLGRELEITRHDYNLLTSRLGQQVRELRSARDELILLNNQLEQRVSQRTTELAETNAQLTQALGELRNAQRDLVLAGQLAGLGALVAGVAHELNTPIGNALTLATTIEHETAVVKAQYAAGELKRSTMEKYFVGFEDIVRALERNLLRSGEIVGQFKQIFVGSIEESRRKFLLEDILSQTLSAVGHAIHRTRARVFIDQTRSIEMDGYPDALRQVITHLVMNSLTHAFQGKDVGSITIHVSDTSNKYVILRCSDDGIGIPADKRSQVFHPFFTTKLGHGRSGLGLFVVYNYVYKILGGEVDLDSEENKGTIVTLELPLIAPLRTDNDARTVHGLPDSY